MIWPASSAMSPCWNSPTPCAPTPYCRTKLNSLPNVTVIKSAQTTEVTGDGQKVNGLSYKDRVSEEIKHRAGRHFCANRPAAGHRLAEGHAGTQPLWRNRHRRQGGQTSAAGVFAAGDCTTAPYKQIIIAMGAGATASLSAFDHLIRSSAPAA